MLRQAGDQAINKAVNAIYVMSADEKLREQARMREKRLHDEASLLATATNRGIEKGRIEGRKEGKEALVQSILKLGFSDEVMAEIQRLAET